jgi:hypothetical protein
MQNCPQGPRPRRLTAVSIKIPPLPQGPLSVREFSVIEAPSTTATTTTIDGETTAAWTAVSQVFTVDNRTGFTAGCPIPVDVQTRLVCLSNQIDLYVNQRDEVVASDQQNAASI